MANNKNKKTLAAVVMTLALSTCVASMTACDKKEAEYKVTFVNGTEEQVITLKKGETVSAPVPTKTGYTFEGWYANENFEGEAVTEITATDLEVKTFYAKFTANTYAVTLNVNGGECEELTSYTYGVGATLPVPTKAGYDFKGWYENANFGGEAVTEITATDLEAKTYYAKFDVKSYAVTLNVNGGECDELTSYIYGVGATLPTATKTGYTFNGWYASENFEGEAVTEITATDVEAKTFYAKFTADTYTVTFMNGNDVVETVSYTIENGSTKTAPAVPTKAGYTGAWGEYDFTKLENQTVAVNYTAITYTVTFKAGETTVETVEYTVENGSTKTAPAVPAKTGYTANGWSEYDFTKLENQTATANYTANTYTVTLNNIEGLTCDELTSYTYGVGATLPTPQREGFAFGGWYDANGAVATQITATDIENKTFTAKWLNLVYTDKAVVYTTQEIKDNSKASGGLSFNQLDTKWFANLPDMYGETITNDVNYWSKTVGVNKLEMKIPEKSTTTNYCFGITISKGTWDSVKINGVELLANASTTKLLFVVNNGTLKLNGNDAVTVDVSNATNFVIEINLTSVIGTDAAQFGFTEFHGVKIDNIDYMANAKTAVTEFTTWYTENAITADVLKADDAKMATFDNYFATIDAAKALMTTYESNLFVDVSDAIKATKTAVATCSVTFTNLAGENQTQTITRGSTVETPVVEKEGYVFGGWYKADGTEFDPSSNIVKDTVLTAKWYVLGDAQKVVVMSPEDIKNNIKTSSGGSSSIVTAGEVNKAWYVDSYGVKYTNVNKFYTTQPISFTIPAVNMAIYSKFEFGLSATTANVSKITVYGYELPINENNIILIENGNIYVFAPGASYNDSNKIGAYNGGDIEVSYDISGGKNVILFELRATQIAYDYVEVVEELEEQIVAFVDANSEATLTDAQKTEAFGLLNSYYNAYGKLDEFEKAAHPVNAKVATLKTILVTATGDYFKGVSATEFGKGAGTYGGTAATTLNVYNNAYQAPYAVTSISSYDFNNGNENGQVMTIILPKINFNALDCAVSINIGKKGNDSVGSVTVNGHKLGKLMQTNYQGIISITKNAEGKFVLRHHIGNGTYDPSYVLSDEEANGEVALTIVLDIEKEITWWGLYVSDLYVKFN